MHDQTDKVFMLTATVVTLLLLLHWLPPMTVGGWTVKPVDILSQLSDSSWRSREQAGRGADGSQADGASAALLLASGDSSWQAATPFLNARYLTDYSRDHALARFLAKLDTLAHRQPLHRPVRIAFFGDSFVEGDIVVGDLREALQARYGGNGVGWVDLGNELSAYRSTFWAQSSGLMEHMAMERQTYDPAKAGIALRYYTMAGSPATFRCHGLKDYPHAMRWQQASLYVQTAQGLSVSSADGGTPFARTVAPSAHVQRIALPAVANGSDPMRLQFQVQGHATDLLYGVALESAEGIVIDNFSMRGESGVKLGKVPETTLRMFQQLRPYDLIVLQYGANVIDETTTDEDLRWFRRGMATTLSRLHRCFPQVPVLVMSTPDRGYRQGQDIGTMPSVHLLVSVQQTLAREHGAAFFNLFEAMGGEGSMARLFREERCYKDLIHLNRSGGREVARRILSPNL